MEGKLARSAWYTGFNERLRELSIEDPDAYKQWYCWYEPKAKQPLWLKRQSGESIDKLKEILDAAIKERRWTHEPLKDGPDHTYTARVVRRDKISHYGTGDSEGDALLEAYISALKGCRGSWDCSWQP